MATYEDGSTKEKEITVVAPSLNNETDLDPKITDGESTDEISDGLFAVLGHDKNFNANIYLFDNNGTIRSELVLNGYRADRIEMIEEGMLYSSSQNTLIVVNRLGKITKQYYLEGYEIHHDFIYDEENNKVLILVNKKDTSTIEERVIALDLNTSEVKEIINLQEYLKENYENASMPTSGKNAYGGSSLDWLHLNSLSLTEAGVDRL